MNRSIIKVLQLVIFIFLIAVADQVIGFLLRQLYFHQKTGPNHALNYSFRDCKADILIFGASAAQHHYNCRIISDSMKMSCYNAGQDGGHSILLQYAQIKIITGRYSPKIIILELNPNFLTLYSRDYDNLQILLPYYKEYPELRPLILLRSPYERVKLLSAIYPFNSNVINIVRFNTNIRAERKKDFEGYVPLKGVMRIDIPKTDSEFATRSVVDTNKIIALQNIIRLCKVKNISLFIISSPIFHRVNEKQSPPSTAAKLALEIIHDNNVNFSDFSFDSAFAGHMEWFKDKAHLNEEGAKIFTSLVTVIIKNNKNEFNFE